MWIPSLVRAGGSAAPAIAGSAGRVRASAANIRTIRRVLRASMGIPPPRCRAQSVSQVATALLLSALPAVDPQVETAGAEPDVDLGGRAAHPDVGGVVAQH